MDEKRKRMTQQELIAFIKTLPPEKLQEIAARAGGNFGRAAQEARCEEFFNKMELLLPSHDSSLRETHHLLARLRAGTPNQPLEPL